VITWTAIILIVFNVSLVAQTTAPETVISDSAAVDSVAAVSRPPDATAGADSYRDTRLTPAANPLFEFWQENSLLRQVRLRQQTGSRGEAEAMYADFGGWPCSWNFLAVIEEVELILADFRSESELYKLEEINCWRETVIEFAEINAVWELQQTAFGAYNGFNALHKFYHAAGMQDSSLFYLHERMDYAAHSTVGVVQNNFVEELRIAFAAYRQLNSTERFIAVLRRYQSSGFSSWIRVKCLEMEIQLIHSFKDNHIIAAAEADAAIEGALREYLALSGPVTDNIRNTMNNIQQRLIWPDDEVKTRHAAIVEEVKALLQQENCTSTSVCRDELLACRQQLIGLAQEVESGEAWDQIQDEIIQLSFTLEDYPAVLERGALLQQVSDQINADRDYRMAVSLMKQGAYFAELDSFSVAYLYYDKCHLLYPDFVSICLFEQAKLLQYGAPISSINRAFAALEVLLAADENLPQTYQKLNLNVDAAHREIVDFVYHQYRYRVPAAAIYALEAPWREVRKN